MAGLKFFYLGNKLEEESYCFCSFFPPVFCFLLSMKVEG